MIHNLTYIYIYIIIDISATALARKRDQCLSGLASVLMLSPLVGFSSEAQSWVSVLVLVLGAGLLVFLKGHLPPILASPRISPKECFFVFFFHRLFDPLLRTRAPRKEYSGELGLQNGSKMEPKMEPKVRQNGSLLKNMKN